MIYQFLLDGGLWMIPILLVSVVGFAFILERDVLFDGAKVIPQVEFT